MRKYAMKEVMLSDKKRILIDSDSKKCILQEYRDGWSMSGGYCGKSWYDVKTLTFEEMEVIKSIDLNA